MEPGFDDPGKFIGANTNTNGVDSISGKHAAASTFKNAECVFLSKNSTLMALIVLSVGLKNVDGVNLINLEGDPWKTLPVKQQDHGRRITRKRLVKMSQVTKPK
jgi:hypothetical protein